MILKFFIIHCLFFWSVSSFGSTSLKIFGEDSLSTLKESHRGKAFMIILWSVDCPPCISELKLLQQNKQRLNNEHLTLVSTDDITFKNNVKLMLQNFQLNHFDNWIFSGTLPERLRYRLDPSWYGELPRAYFYNSSHQRFSHSGTLSLLKLNEWIKQMKQPVSMVKD